ncbi:transcription initiation factor IIB family protein [Halomicrobium salinisoli]|uniref:transcription initiation factor IIB family protein n=1 Tax=Halomicrobium salinisoli TaxID=2878391 RepID=UPI001CF04D27|nr:transcription initiation factor IIB family protein [Halomicrobium salinisoli]
MTGNDTDPIARRIGTQEWAEETTEIANVEIERLCNSIEVGEMVEQLSQAIYHRGIKTDVVQNTNIATLAAASVYIASKREGEPISQNKVILESHCTKRDFNTTYSHLLDKLEIEVGPTDPRVFIPRYCAKLELSETVENKAIEIIDTAEDEREDILSGKSPSGFAAASIYAASLLCNEKKTQKEVAGATGVSAATIRYRYQEQIQAIGIY